MIRVALKSTTGTFEPDALAAFAVDVAADVASLRGVGGVFQRDADPQPLATIFQPPASLGVVPERQQPVRFARELPALTVPTSFDVLEILYNDGRNSVEIDLVDVAVDFRGDETMPRLAPLSATLDRSLELVRVPDLLPVRAREQAIHPGVKRQRLSARSQGGSGLLVEHVHVDLATQFAKPNSLGEAPPVVLELQRDLGAPNRNNHLRNARPELQREVEVPFERRDSYEAAVQIGDERPQPRDSRLRTPPLPLPADDLLGLLGGALGEPRRDAEPLDRLGRDFCFCKVRAKLFHAPEPCDEIVNHILVCAEEFAKATGFPCVGVLKKDPNGSSHSARYLSFMCLFHVGVSSLLLVLCIL